VQHYRRYGIVLREEESFAGVLAGVLLGLSVPETQEISEAPAAADPARIHAGLRICALLWRISRAPGSATWRPP
jgi:hypothetical protein